MSSKFLNQSVVNQDCNIRAYDVVVDDNLDVNNTKTLDIMVQN
jgi:hypothetical protein